MSENIISDIFAANRRRVPDEPESVKTDKIPTRPTLPVLPFYFNVELLKLINNNNRKYVYVFRVYL